MKMVKSLLLGSAAGLVAIAGAQAADLPVKAKPVQYVKICSLYGAGFYYIPGTDTCLKVGGFVRAELNVNTASGSYVQYNSVNFDDRATNDTHMRTRGGITVDARTQTAYGTLRAYTVVAPTVTDIAPGTGTAIWHHRAFIQFAGFTAGLSVSYFDFDPISSYSNQTNRLGSSTGGTGIPLFAYTAQFGNGFSASISAESPAQRRTSIAAISAAGAASTTAVVSPTATPPATILATVTTGAGFGLYVIPTAGAAAAVAEGYGGYQWPDIVGNLHVDQSWGSAQVMGAIHQVHYNYWVPGTTTSGSPGDDIGYALGAGIKLNLPGLGKGDFLITQFAYAKGAMKYVGSGLAGYDIRTGTALVNHAWGPMYDAVYAQTPGSPVYLTEGWSVTAGLQHNWMPGWKTSIYGAYGEFNYDAGASMLLATVAPVGGTVGSADWSMYQIGSRTV